MATPDAYATALVTGLVLLAVGMFVIRGRAWRRYSPSVSGGAGGLAPAAEQEGVPLRWLARAVLVVTAAGLVGLLVVSSATGMLPAVFGVIGGFALVLLAFLVWGVYTTARFRGLYSAQAAGATVLLVGLLVVVAIMVKLMLG